MLFLSSSIANGTPICTKLTKENRNTLVSKLSLHLIKLS